MTLRLTEEEKERFLEKTATAGVTPAGYVKSMILGRLDEENRIRMNADAVQALQKTADSLFLIALKREEMGTEDTEQYWKEAERARAAVQALLSALYAWQSPPSGE